MKLVNREVVDGTRVTIGHRAYYKKKKAKQKTLEEHEDESLIRQRDLGSRN
ncbi:MAG: hypothetical protein JXB29_07705 [Sedimentisphaerales bacterium]|nr:hypothetical protein [Sedimentisphaerales bacterium]